MPSWVSFDPSLKISLKDLVERSDTVKNVLCFLMWEAVFCFFTCIYHQDFFLTHVKQGFLLSTMPNKSDMKATHQMSDHMIRRQSLTIENGLQTSLHALIGFDLDAQDLTIREFQPTTHDIKSQVRQYTETTHMVRRDSASCCFLSFGCMFSNANVRGP